MGIIALPRAWGRQPNGFARLSGPGVHHVAWYPAYGASVDSALSGYIQQYPASAIVAGDGLRMLAADGEKLTFRVPVTAGSQVLAHSTWTFFVTLRNSGFVSFAQMIHEAGPCDFVQRRAGTDYVAMGALFSGPEILNRRTRIDIIVDGGGTTNGSGINYRIIFNGTQVSSGSAATYFNRSYIDISLGSVRGPTTEPADIDIHGVFFALETLDDAYNPWSLFRRSPLIIPHAVAPGGTTHDIAGAGGATSDGIATSAYEYALAAVGVILTDGAAGASAEISIAAVGYQVTGGSAEIQSGAVQDLAAAGGTTAAGGAAPAASVTIAAADLATAAGQAGLSADLLTAGAGAASAAGNAGLAAQLNALAAGAAQAGGLAAISGGAAGELSAAGGARSIGAAGIKITATFVAQGTSYADGAAGIEGGAAGTLSASGGAASAGQAVAHLAALVTAAGFVQAMGAGYLVIQAPLEAIGAAMSTGEAMLEDAAALVLIRSPRFVVSASGRRFSVAAPGRTFKVSR